MTTPEPWVEELNKVLWRNLTSSDEEHSRPMKRELADELIVFIQRIADQSKREGREEAVENLKDKIRKYCFSYTFTDQMIVSGIEAIERLEVGEKRNGFHRIGEMIMEEGMYKMDARDTNEGVGYRKEYSILVVPKDILSSLQAARKGSNKE